MTITFQSSCIQRFLISLGFITKIFGLSEFALIGNWTVLALHGHEVTVSDDVMLQFLQLFFALSKGFQLLLPLLI